jgi:hypothetical protein
MCTTTLPCLTIQLITIVSILSAIVLTYLAFRKPQVLLLVLPLALFSFEALARAGGGGGGGRCGFLCVILSPFILIYMAYVSYRINSKNKGIKEALAIMAQREPQWNEDNLINTANQIFRDLQTAWGKHDLETIKNHLHPNLYPEWETQIQQQKLRNERNVMVGLSVNNIRFVNVKNMKDNDHDEFTVCIDAEAKDQILSNIQIVKAKFEKFREFWTFDWENGKWTVREVTQSDGWKKYVYSPIVDEMNRGILNRKR